MKKILAVPMAVVLASSGICYSYADNIKNDIKVERISGNDRYKTSVEISKKSFVKADSVIIASGEKFQDALVGSVFAGKINAPILLTSLNNISYETEKEIKRLNAKKIYILGGKNSISEEIEKMLAKNYKVIRISGNDRYETSNKIATEIKKDGGSEKIAIASGITFADALSAGPAMSKKGIPIILTNGKNVKNIDVSKIEYIFGGENTIKAEGINAKRISGEDRYETSLKIAKEFYDESKTAVISSGAVFADALSAGPLAHKINAPILLSGKNEIPEKYIEKYKKGKERIIVVGGESSISKRVFDLLNDKSKSSEGKRTKSYGKSHGKKYIDDMEKKYASKNDIAITKEKAKSVLSSFERVKEKDVFLKNTDISNMEYEKNKKINELKRKVEDILKKLDTGMVTEESLNEYNEFLNSKHGVIGDAGFYLKMDIDGNKLVKSKEKCKEGVNKFIRLRKKDGKYVFKILSDTKGMIKDDGKDKTDVSKVKKYIKLNYVTRAGFDGKKAEDTERIINNGNIDVVTAPTPKYEKYPIPLKYKEDVDRSTYDVKEVEGGYEVMINSIPEDSLIIKPVMIEKLKDGSVLESGTMIFLEQNDESHEKIYNHKEFKELKVDSKNVKKEIKIGNKIDLSQLQIILKDKNDNEKIINGIEEINRFNKDKTDGKINIKVSDGEHIKDVKSEIDKDDNAVIVKCGNITIKDIDEDGNESKTLFTINPYILKVDADEISVEKEKPVNILKYINTAISVYEYNNTESDKENKEKEILFIKYGKNQSDAKIISENEYEKFIPREDGNIYYYVTYINNDSEDKRVVIKDSEITKKIKINESKPSPDADKKYQLEKAVLVKNSDGKGVIQVNSPKGKKLGEKGSKVRIYIYEESIGKKYSDYSARGTNITVKELDGNETNKNIEISASDMKKVKGGSFIVFLEKPYLSFSKDYQENGVITVDDSSHRKMKQENIQN